MLTPSHSINDCHGSSCDHLKLIGCHAIALQMSAEGYTSPTPIQATCWPIIATGKDLVGIASTGSGKTSAFLMPGLVRVAQQPEEDKHRYDPSQPSILILAPTRELACQIVDEAKKFSKVFKKLHCV